MKGKDRTADFQTAVENLRQKKLALSKPDTLKISPRKESRTKSTFSIVAAQIGKQIGDTSDKLERLTKRNLLLFNSGNYSHFL